MWIGSPEGTPAARVSPKRESDGRIVASTAAGIPNNASIAGSQSSVSSDINWVRDALLGSVACAAPPVSRDSSQLSTVPARSSPASARARAPGVSSRSQASLVLDASGSTPSPVAATIAASCGRSAAQRSEVRRHCQLIAGATASPLAASQSNTVSRWLAMAMVATSTPGVVASTSAIAPATLPQIASADCSAHPGRGTVTPSGCEARPSTSPLSAAISSALVLVVPWSTARIATRAISRAGRRGRAPPRRCRRR
ncbi:hypothetical protein PIB19_21940 [Sphingomonas sp. 7/4-4]|nr:hypothetical protein [Sphingomonas sp. 7/4-4]WBY07883.1 hypothetical protein PIB19_21940 [Sphingomonas sp. 7/4-4]